MTSLPDAPLPPLIDHCIVISGPTASGKTDLALDLAELIGGEILSLDSIAVYQGMDIGTAKPNRDEQERVPHHLIDLVPPTDDFSVAMYLESAHRVVDEILSRGKRPIFVGGTPMFLKAVLRGFDPGPAADWEFREQVERDILTHGVGALHERLRQVDPLSAAKIDANDSRRMIRALEVSKLTGQPISHRQLQFEAARKCDQCHAFVIQRPREELHRRINDRVDRMFEDGLIEEVRRLVTDRPPLSRTARQAVGYREILDAIGNPDPAGNDDDGCQDEGMLPLQMDRPSAWESLASNQPLMREIKEQIAAHTRQMARRQETWFRSLDELTPISADEIDGRQARNQFLLARFHDFR